MDEVQGAEIPRAARISAAALLLATSVLLSRLLGYAREALLAYRIGAGPSTDAFYAAFQIPDLLNYLLAGGAFSIAFLPLYTKHLARGDTAGAHTLLTTALGTLTAVAIAATAALWWWAEPLIALQFPRFDPTTQALTAHLTRIVLPAQVFFIAGGIVNATLFAHGRFGAAALSPLLYNAAIIAGGLFLAPHLAVSVDGFAWGVLVGAILGPFLAPVLYARGRVRLGLRVAPFDRVFLGYMVIAAPLIFGQTLLTVDEWYQRWFGALLGTGAVSHLTYARRLMQVPVAVIGQALAAAALPALARLFADGRHDELNRTVLRTLQTGLALTTLVAAGLLVLAQTLVHVVYQRGAFTANDTVAVAAILSVLALATPAWVLQQIIVRAFYARADTWRPMLLGTAVALAAIPLYLSLGHSFGVQGLAVAAVIGITVNALAALAWARWLHGGPPLRELASTATRSVVIAVPAAVAAHYAAGVPPDSLSVALRQLALGSAAFTGIALAGIFVIGDDAMRDLLRRVTRRFV